LSEAQSEPAAAEAYGPKRPAAVPGSAVTKLPFWRVVVATVLTLRAVIAAAPEIVEGPWLWVTISIVIFGIPYLWWLAAARWRHYSSRDVLGERLRWTHLPAVLSTALAVLGVRMGLVVLLIAADMIPSSWHRASEPQTLPLKLITMLIAVVIGPCAEEICFRGLMFRRLLRHTRPVRAALISSFAFGLLHLDPVGSTLFAVAMVVLYVRTRSLWVPTLAHMLNNLLVSLTSVAGPSLVENLPAWLLFALSAFCLPWLLWLLRGWRGDITSFAQQER
jgi:membrane protease YdiL (CAAX protease family)